jgi:hypothetical protein
MFILIFITIAVMAIIKSMFQNKLEYHIHKTNYDIRTKQYLELLYYYNKLSPSQIRELEEEFKKPKQIKK